MSRNFWVLIGGLIVGMGTIAALILFNGSTVVNAPTSPPSVAPAGSSSSDTATAFTTGVVHVPQGHSTISVYSQPSLSSSVVAEVANGTTISILCTAQSDVVTNPDTGQSSSLWDGTNNGFIPDVYVHVDTRTNQAMGSC
jgi:hypothetical protein